MFPRCFHGYRRLTRRAMTWVSDGEEPDLKLFSYLRQRPALPSECCVLPYIIN